MAFWVEWLNPKSGLGLGLSNGIQNPKNVITKAMDTPGHHIMHPLQLPPTQADQGGRHSILKKEQIGGQSRSR